jgi:hypothetical protein
MHYEVELLTYEADGTGGLRVTGEVWRPVRVFRADNITTPLVPAPETVPAGTV